MKRPVWMVAVVLAASTLPTDSVCLAVDDAERARLYEIARRASAWVQVPADKDRKERNGFAFAIAMEADKPILVTSYHLVGDEEQVGLYYPVFIDGKVVVFKDYYRHNEIRRNATVIATDSARDLALITTWGLPKSVRPLVIADEVPQRLASGFSVSHKKEENKVFLEAPLIINAVGFDVWRGEAGGWGAGRMLHQLGGVRDTSAGAPLVNTEGKAIGVLLGPKNTSESLSIAANELLMMLGKKATDDGPAPSKTNPLVGRWTLTLEKEGRSQPAGGLVFHADGRMQTVFNGQLPATNYVLKQSKLTIAAQNSAPKTHQLSWNGPDLFEFTHGDHGKLIARRFRPVVRPYFEYTSPVMANWTRDNYWYPARAYLRRDDQTRVQYLDDESKEFLGADRIATLDLRVGDAVEGNWKMEGKYYPAKIAALEKDRRTILKISLLYEDGEKETTALKAIRQSADQVRK